MAKKKSAACPDPDAVGAAAPVPTVAAGHDASATALGRLLDVLAITDLGGDRFQGGNVDSGRKRIYGGQVLAQAVIAASRTVDPARPMHSLHAYFLVGGKPAEPVIYATDRLRDGGSFTTRQVTALQGAETLFSMCASFHRDEPGLVHQAAMPETPPPEEVATVAELLARADISMPAPMRAYYSREMPIDVRFVDIGRFLGTDSQPPCQRIWFKVRGALPDTPALHRALLAYASDFSLVETALLPHGRLIFGGDLQLASLDHALWFHRPFRADDWLLYAVDSPMAHGGRGFSRGAFFTADGQIVASVAQEMLMRPTSA